MKKLLISLIIALAALPVWAGNKNIPQRDTLRILAIGNSFSVDGVEQYLWELFDAAGIPVIIGNMYIGGCSLERHWNNAGSNAPAYSYRKIRNGVRTVTKEYSLEKVFSDEPWNVISFQQQSGKSGLYESYQPYLHRLVEFVRAHSRPDAVFLWYQTWAYAGDSTHRDFPNYGNSQKQMYKAIVSASKRAIKEEKLNGVIPGGTAIQNGRKSSLGDSFNRDGYHLEKTYGRFTVACTWFEAVSGESVLDNPYFPDSITSETADICRRAAHNACRHPWKVKF